MLKQDCNGNPISTFPPYYAFQMIQSISRQYQKPLWSSCPDKLIGSKVTTDVATKLLETTKVQNYLHITLKLNEKFQTNPYALLSFSNMKNIKNLFAVQ